ncbi:MAG TPA: hypothetical protein VKJ07_13785 [Mycobacteriales bacterium]|nr:hypothetical protein [Mycobacteriales bacterium]
MAEVAQTDPAEADDAAVDAIVGRGPSGAFAVAGVATAIVVAIYFAFYFVVYLPRGAVQ